jgi:hypothetical protein
MSPNPVLLVGRRRQEWNEPLNLFRQSLAHRLEIGPRRLFRDHGHIGIPDHRAECREKIRRLGADPSRACDPLVVGGGVRFPPIQPEVGCMDSRLLLVELAELGLESRLHRPLAKQPSAESVGGPQECAVELCQGVGDQGGTGALPFLFERLLELLPKLRPGLPRKRDRGKLGRTVLPRCDKGNHPSDQTGRLSGARGRLDHHRDVEIVRNPIALRLIGRHLRFARHHSTSLKRFHASTPGSSGSASSFALCAATLVSSLRQIEG